MDRLRFPYVVSVLVVIFLFGAVLRQAKPLIPPEPETDLIREPGDFARPGIGERIPWMSMGLLALSEARRLDRPLLVFIEAPWSAVARDLAANAWRDPDVRAFVRRHFVPVRIDASQRPEWLNTFLPVSRTRLGFIPDAQLWLLNSEGRILSEVFFRDPASRTDPSWLLNQLFGFREQHRKARLEPWNVDPPGLQQTLDLQRLAIEPEASTPDLELMAERIRASIAPQGGFADAAGLPRLLPQAYRFLAITADWDGLARALDPLLRSALVDWVDGGFFLRPADRSLARPQYDKVAVHNAELMQAIAVADARRPDPLYREVARRCARFLLKGLRQGSYLAACRVGDEKPNGRSRRSSFPPRELRFGPNPKPLFERWGCEPFNVPQWCRDHLALRVEENPAMVPRLSDPGVLASDRQRFEAALAWLKAIADGKRGVQLAGMALADVNLTVAARATQTARIWGDRALLTEAGELWDRLAVLETGGDVARGLYLAEPGSPYLGDYLAFADAALQDFLANGRVVSLEAGLRVLLRARELFQTSAPGAWALTTQAGTVLPDARAPELVDNVGESCTAKVIRLAFSYGRLLRGGGRQASVAAMLAQDAAAAVARFGALATELGADAAAYGCAAWAVMDESHAVVVGPDCVETATRIYRRVPHRLVAPCLGPVRPDLQRRPNGVYVIQGTSVNGPLSEEQAVRRLGGL
ncbi:MAG: DUF255 domain-containing protein [Fimbriimonadales bacterium]|nr:DUF255 domain-containing protein [Fimbriimonadales bacterium]